jgi:DNA-directed RNA polymerase subunit beta'
MINTVNELEGISIGLLSKEKIESLANGEVEIPKTIDAVTGLPVPGGLMCQKIFGPVDYLKCACGKRFSKKGIQCPVCGVVTDDPIVRRRTFGKITLAHPVVHPWFRRILSAYLNIPPRKFDQLINCDIFVVFAGGRSGFEKGSFIPAPEFIKYKAATSVYETKDESFRAMTGGDAVKELIREMDLSEAINRLKRQPPSRRNNKRLLLLRDMARGGVDPGRMVIEVLPVLPAGLRPVIRFDDGTTASSDLNDLYARIIIKNNRLRFFMEEDALPFFTVPARKALQQSVDSLLDKKYETKTRSGKRVLKSLTSHIESKNGRLRRNLLGKRVDYSGRSVITSGPFLKLRQCGIPLELAMGLARPFVYGRMRRTGIAYSLKHAMRLCDMLHESAIQALEDEMKKMVVILNRAPSLHRLSMQAFDPVLVKERAIRLHPLTCSGFNADFDGDQMGVHLPVSKEAQAEARALMLSPNNLLSPASGKVAMSPSQDMVLGIYWLTKEDDISAGRGKVFADTEDALIAYDHGIVDLQAPVKVRIDGGTVETTPGRIIFSRLFPPIIPFQDTNRNIKKRDLGKLIEKTIEEAGTDESVLLLDRLKDAGFEYATLAGISLSIADATIPKEKRQIIEETEKDVSRVEEEFSSGLMEEKEKHNKIVSLWLNATDRIANAMMDGFGAAEETLSPDERKRAKEFNSIFMMADSGARGSKEQIRQLAGIRGLMARPNGDIVEMPIKSNFKEGLSYFEYLLSCHGARKGRADGALKTANAGYFTRRLVDIASDIIINETDCGTFKSFTMKTLLEKDEVVIPLEERITGRVAASRVRDPLTGDVLIENNEVISKSKAKKIVSRGISEVKVRSPLFCDLEHGICAMCYGHQPSRRALPEIGEAVGILAAQSIGEPGTQLTLRTFHSGGSASGGDHKSFIEARQDGMLIIKDAATVTDNEGRRVVVNRNARLCLKTDGIERELGTLRYGSYLFASENEEVRKGRRLAEWDPFNLPVVSTTGGEARFEGVIRGLTAKEEKDAVTGVRRTFITTILTDKVPKIIIGEKEYQLPIGAMPIVREGQRVSPGDVIAKIPKQAAKNVDITGGLARVLELLEVRRVKNKAVMTEIDGEVRIAPPRQGYVPIEVVSDSGEKREYRVGLGEQLNFYNGDRIKAGDLLHNGAVAVEDILRIRGIEAASAYIIDEVQKVYRMQGVETNDKHFEVILRKMTNKVVITHPGDTDFVTGERVLLKEFLRENQGTVGRKAIAITTIVSLTKASLESESWISAASFQNTKEILSNAAVRNKTDCLKGTKEKIILGAPVPIGTGHPSRVQPPMFLKRLSKKEKKRLEALEKLKRLFGSSDLC